MADKLTILRDLKNHLQKGFQNSVKDIVLFDLKYNIIIDAHFILLREIDTLKGKQPIFTTALRTEIYA